MCPSYACERHIVRSAKHALHRQRHRSKICLAAMHFVRHDKRLLCQRVTGPGPDQFTAVELPYGTENCWQGAFSKLSEIRCSVAGRKRLCTNPVQIQASVECCEQDP